MRWLFIILLAANLLYLGWELDRQTRIDTGNARQVLMVPSGVRNLTLVREMNVPPPPKAGQRQEVPDVAPADETGLSDNEPVPVDERDKSDVRIEEQFVNELVSQLPGISIPSIDDGSHSPMAMCFSYGPFPDNQQVSELMDWFRQRDVTIAQRLEAGDDNQLFWIYLAPQASRGNALQALDDLKKKGVKDYHLIETGDLRNAISLGLFSTQASVNRRLNELHSKGYQPVVVPHRNKKAIYWVDVRLVGRQDVLNLMFTGYPARYNSIPVNCSEIALPRLNP